MPGEDNVKHRRWLVIDSVPSAAAKSGTVVSECLGESAARMICDALNGIEPEMPPQPDLPQPGIPEVDLVTEPF